MVVLANSVWKNCGIQVITETTRAAFARIKILLRSLEWGDVRFRHPQGVGVRCGINH